MYIHVHLLNAGSSLSVLWMVIALFKKRREVLFEGDLLALPFVAE